MNVIQFTKKGKFMNSVNKTLYIPLYGKSFVSKKGIILKDEKAEEIWEKEQFSLKGKSKSKYLAYYMGMRSRVFDDWVKSKMEEDPEVIVIHLGCGLDSRVLRVETENHLWFDVDFPEVIEERKRYYSEKQNYKMLAGDVRTDSWLKNLPKSKNAIILMEGISMYLTLDEIKNLVSSLKSCFEHFSLLMDCYSDFAAKMSKYKNPINDVGVTTVYGIDNPKILESENLAFVKEHNILPEKCIEELKGFEKLIFKKLYASSFAKKLYKLYEFIG